MERVDRYFLGKSEILGIIIIIILSIAYRYSLLLRIATHVYFNGADYSIFTWILAWDCHAIEVLKLKGFWATNAMYPYPYVLAFSENLIGLLPIAFPIWMFTHNPVLTFNLTMHILLVLTASSSYIILRKIVDNNLAALVGAIIFSFYSYNLWNYTIGHPHMIGLMILPVITYVNLRYWEGGKTRYLVMLVVMWFWNFLISIYIGVLLSLYLGIWNIIWWLKERALFSVSKIIKWCVSVMIVWIMMIPIFWEYYRVVEDMGAIRTLEHQERYTGYVWSWLIAPPDNVLWHNIIGIFKHSRIMSAEDCMFPGVTVFLLFLASYMIKGMPEWLRGLRISSIILAILAMGPYALGLSVKIPLPYGLVWYLFPPLRAVRNPHRLSIFVLLGISIVAAYTLNEFLKEKKRLAIGIIILVLYCIETFTYYNPVEGMHPEAAKIYHALQLKEKNRVIIELPMPRNWSGWVSETKPLMHSTYHWNYVFNGISGLWPPAQFQVGKELKNFPSEHTISLLQSLGIDTILVNENRYSKKLEILLKKMNETKQLRFIKRIGNVSVWYLEQGPKAADFNPNRHIKLICKKRINSILSDLIIEIKDEHNEFIFNWKAPARWKFPIAEPWKIEILDEKDKVIAERKWDTPAIFHNKNNHYEVGLGNGIRIFNKIIKCSE